MLRRIRLAQRGGQALPSLVLIGCALAWLRARTRSVYPGMLVHATFNAVALIGAVTVG